MWIFMYSNMKITFSHINEWNHILQAAMELLKPTFFSAGDMKDHRPLRLSHFGRAGYTGIGISQRLDRLIRYLLIGSRFWRVFLLFTSIANHVLCSASSGGGS